MSDKRGPILAVFDKSTLQRLTRHLGVNEFTPPQLDRLEKAALTYWFLKETDLNREVAPSRSHRRKALNEIARIALDLLAKLDPDQTKVLGIEDEARTLRKGLARLSDLAKEKAEQTPRGNADPKTARPILVRELKAVYESATRKRATRSVNPISGVDSGPFLEFCRMAFGYLDKSALKGLEGDVRKAVASVKTRKS